MCLTIPGGNEGQPGLDRHDLGPDDDGRIHLPQRHHEELDEPHVRPVEHGLHVEADVFEKEDHDDQGDQCGESQKNHHEGIDFGKINGDHFFLLLNL